MGDFRMPSLGADMEAGTLVEWSVKPGDAVKRGQVVALVETQKGIVEVEVWEGGVVEALHVAAGAKVPVGTVLATIAPPIAVASRAAEAPPSARAPAPPPPTPTAPAPAPSASTAAATPSSASAKPHTNGASAPVTIVEHAPTHVLASPAARQRARELGIDLATVRGRGPHGAVTRDDVERATAASSAPRAAVAPPPEIPAPRASSAAASAPSPRATTGMRDAIAAAMARSKREIPHYYLATDVDVTRAVAWLEATNAARPVEERVLFAALLVKAVAEGCREVPEVNGFWTDGAFHPAEGAHVGVAIALRQGGLIAPAIRDAHAKSITDVMADLRDLVARARAGRLRSSELSDPTITLTNLGDQGVQSVFGVIYPPQVALVGVGKPTERAWASGGMIGARTIVTVTLAADHRASDGHRGARFLQAIARVLEDPQRLSASPSPPASPPTETP